MDFLKDKQKFDALIKDVFNTIDENGIYFSYLLKKIMVTSNFKSWKELFLKCISYLKLK